MWSGHPAGRPVPGTVRGRRFPHTHPQCGHGTSYQNSAGALGVGVAGALPRRVPCLLTATLPQTIKSTGSISVVSTSGATFAAPVPVAAAGDRARTAAIPAEALGDWWMRHQFDGWPWVSDRSRGGHGRPVRAVALAEASAHVPDRLGTKVRPQFTCQRPAPRSICPVPVPPSLPGIARSASPVWYPRITARTRSRSSSLVRM